MCTIKKIIAIQIDKEIYIFSNRIFLRNQEALQETIQEKKEKDEDQRNDKNFKIQK
jgi:hypothetical protein